MKACLGTLDGAAMTRLDATDHAVVADYFVGFARIDILIYVVGVVHQGTIEECSLED